MTSCGYKSVLVTGAAGFIGSHLTERLVREGMKVKALVHYNSRNDWGLLERIPKDTLKEIEVISGDLRDPFSMASTVKGCEVVFHLASLIAIPYSYNAPQAYAATNVMGTLNVLQACLSEGVQKVVHTSTSETYGTARYVPIDEKHPMQGQSPYSATKIGADKIAESYYHSFGLPVATIRPFNTYGPRQSARAIIPTVISQALSGRNVHLGNLTPTRDLNFVADTVDGFFRIAHSDAALGEVINIGSGKEISIGDLVNKIIAIVGNPVELIIDEERIRPCKSEVERLLCDNAKALRLTGWKPQTSLTDGLEQTVRWIRENLDRYKPDIYNL